MNASTESIAGRERAANSERRRRQPLWLAGVIATAALLSHTTVLMAEPPQADRAAGESTASPLAEFERLLRGGELSAAAEQLASLREASPPDVDLTLPSARLGRAYQRSGQVAEAAQTYLQAVQASERAAAASLSPEQKSLVRLTGASALLKTDSPAEALDCLRPVVDGSLDAPAAKRSYAANLLLTLGAQALAGDRWQISREAYELAASQLSGDAQATAELGVAWSLAVSGRDLRAAADRLEAFLDRHGEHADAPRAARARVACLKRAGEPEQVAEALAELLRRWPEHDAARQVVRDHHAMSLAEVPAPVRQWLLDRAAGARSLEALDAATIGLGLRLAADEENVQAWDVLAEQLAAADRTGGATSDVLQRLAANQRAAEAERLATRLIAPRPGAETTPQAREAACRWAGRSQRWSMLALASESQRPGSPDGSRTPAIERLFAESLMQTGRSAEARLWWEYLVDHRGAEDFATLLRCAESAVAAASVDQATARLEAARGAAGEDSGRSCLLDMLEAELSVRRLRFDEARALLERVVRGSESPEALRARAQWTIGETYYMQERHAEAIDAYRRVEGLDGSGLWTPAALVQAGKAFEQLGRTREAAVCYSNLVGRFADSPHARAARRRLAALRPDSRDPQSAQNQ